MNKLVPIVIIALTILYFNCCKDNFDPTSIKDKRVLITGASSGIGEQLAYQYSRLGARVFITARRQNLLEKVATKCKELGAKQVEFVRSDLGEQKDRDEVIVEVKKRFGGLDNIILNHAIISPGLWLGNEANMTKLRKELNVNFISYVDLASQALPDLMRSKGNIGVVSAMSGKFAIAGFASASTNKHALHGFFSALRQELLLRNTGVSVTMIVLGPVDTDIMGYTKDQKQQMMPNMWATAEDTASAIMRGVANRKYEIYHPIIAHIMALIHKIIPGYIEDYSGRMYLEMNGVI